MSFGIRAALPCCPAMFAAAASPGCGGPVCGTGVMLSKAVSLVLFVAIPGFLGYPAPLDVDPSQKKQRRPWKLRSGLCLQRPQRRWSR